MTTTSVFFSVLAITATLGQAQICSRLDCFGRGTCIGGTALAPLCLCDLGYTGIRCETEPLCTNLFSCSNNGFCLGTAKSFICICNIGFTGTTCALLG